MANKQVIIIGARPAGIFAALDLARYSHIQVTLLEAGEDLPARQEAWNHPHDPTARRRAMLEGFGGAGAFCDGKLTMSAQVGGSLGDLLGEQRAADLIETADSLWVEFGAPQEVFGANEQTVRKYQDLATRSGMRLMPVPLRHIGSDRTPHVLQGMRDYLAERIDLRTGFPATALQVKDGAVQGVLTPEGLLSADAIVVAPGRVGSQWLWEEALRLGIETEPGPVDLGVRVEVPAALTQAVTDDLFEFKLLYWSRVFDNLVRTFCVCPWGQVITTEQGGVITVNGHSTSERLSENTNFAVLVTSRFTHPFDDPIGYGQYIARLANLLGDGVLVQRLGDLRSGHRSTPSRISHSTVLPTLKEATPGDLSYVLPYRHMGTLLEMMEALDRFAPGLGDDHTLFYGVEVKLYSSRLRLNENLETPVHSLFACGDGAGITRGLMQASASGLAAAQALRARWLS